jgi:uncharacterized damage-inducible protein DinB
MDRHDPALAADERTMLSQFLDFHRATLLWKVEGLDHAQLNTTTAVSDLTLGGLLKHLALVEDSWFGRVLQDIALPAPWNAVDWDADPDWDFHSAAGDQPADLIALYQQACERSRAAVAAVASLDDLSVGTSRRTGDRFSLRWIMLHMIEETARHNGHADFLREAIDGQTGE